MCNKQCQSTTCPFAFTDESENIQNYGCLPTPFEIIAMREIRGKTWACHSEPSKPCAGGLEYLREYGLDARILDRNLITEENITKELVTYNQSEIANLRAKMSQARLASVSE